MSARSENAVYVYVGAFVDELQRAGVQHVVICPGSRSTPLALTFAAHEQISTWMQVDERSAAFFALGMAKQLRQPVALLCTSGTAAANFLPAIVEAHLSHVPLLILTADRPHELRDCGAPQSIDQNRLYGIYVKWFVDVALPEATNAALRSIRTLASRATALVQAVPAGPVHLNFPFREPLTPGIRADQQLPLAEERDDVAWQGRPGNAPFVQVRDVPLAAPAHTTITHLAKMLRAKRRGLLIAGPFAGPGLAAPLTRLAGVLGYPLLADPLSQVRCGEHDLTMVLSSYDAFLRNEGFVERVVPEVVLRFGAFPTSKPLQLYLKRYAACPLVVIDGNGDWPEPTQLAAELIHADPVAFCQHLLDELETPRGGSAPTSAFETDEPEPSGSWLSTWQEADQVTQVALHSAMLDFPQPFEGRVFSELTNILPDGSTLYVGNSMPVRDLDTFFWKSVRRLHFMANRGANGIDGVISSALGASAAATGTPTVLVLGDLSFFHDLNGLLAARLHQLSLTIVLVNNDGGGIFSFLPQADEPEHFERLFGTPTGLDFRLAVQMYGGHYQRASTWREFRTAIEHGLSKGGLHVVEVQTERESNVRMHRQLWRCVEQALNHDESDA